MLKLLFILIQVAISLYVGIHGFIDWFPIFAAVLFTWCLDTKSEVRLKLVIITAQVMWFLYDYVYINYVGCVFDGLTIPSNTIGRAAEGRLRVYAGSEHKHAAQQPTVWEL